MIFITKILFKIENGYSIFLTNKEKKAKIK